MEDGARKPLHSRLVAATTALALVTLAGCGHSGQQATPEGNVPVLGAQAQSPKAAQTLGFPGFATKNTTRVGGADPFADAAAVSEAVYVSASPTTHPQVVTLANGSSWQGALAAAVFMSSPLRAPELLTQGDSMPAASSDALSTLAPTGSSAADGAQVIRVGSKAGTGSLRTLDVGGGDPYALAAAIDRLQIAASGSPSSAVVVVAADQPAYAMPAASWAAKSGDPILYVARDSVPSATVTALRAHQHPAIYILGPPSVVSPRVAGTLRTLGTVKRIDGANPVANAIAFARYTDGSFGWGVTDPGHGLVFVNAARPADAAAAAPLSSSGDYGPMLVTDSATRLPAALRGYLLDIQPGYDKDPARGFYNHGWLIGDEHAISLAEQATIDSLLEISPVTTAPAAPTPSPAPTGPTGPSAPVAPRSTSARPRSGASVRHRTTGAAGTRRP